MDPAAALVSTKIDPVQNNAPIFTLPSEILKIVLLMLNQPQRFIVSCVCRRFKGILSEDTVVVETYRFRVTCLWERNYPSWQRYIKCDPTLAKPTTPRAWITAHLECRKDYKQIPKLLNSEAEKFVEEDPTLKADYKKRCYSDFVDADPIPYQEYVRYYCKINDFKDYLVENLKVENSQLKRWFNNYIQQEVVEEALYQALEGHFELLKWLAGRGLTLQKLKAVCVAVNFRLTEELVVKVFPPT